MPKTQRFYFSKGRVTLKGPVTSEDEKNKVEELAKGCAGVTSVKNMLTIAPQKIVKNQIYISKPKLQIIGEKNDTISCWNRKKPASKQKT